MVRVYMVRHGRASAGWDTDSDPGLDEIGRGQADRVAQRLAAFGPIHVVSSPLRRCRETASFLESRWNSEAQVVSAVAEIPSPVGIPMGERLDWLRTAMAGTWSSLGPRYIDFRDGVGAYVASLTEDTVITSHFVAINAAIGVATGDDSVVIRSLDNCSVTIFDVANGVLTLIEGGYEADTLIR